MNEAEYQAMLADRAMAETHNGTTAQIREAEERRRARVPDLEAEVIRLRSEVDHLRSTLEEAEELMEWPRRPGGPGR